MAIGLLLVGTALCCGCAGFFEQPDPKSTPVNLRIENGASSFVEVTIAVSDDEAAETETPTTEDGGGTVTGEESPGRELPAADPADAPSADAEQPVETADAQADPHEPAVETELEVITIGLRDPLPPEDNSESRGKAVDVTLKEQLSEDTVRVPPQEFTDGLLACGDEITITATIDTTQTTQVVLEGVGTGTPGFDEGSVGLEGERLLLKDVHFNCGDTLVVRVTDTGTGQIEVFEPGTTVPEPDFSAGPTIESGEEHLEFRINNQTVSLVELQISEKPVAGPSEDESSDEADSLDSGSTVRVPPGFLTTGVVTCDPQIILVGSIVRPAIDAQEPDEFNHAVLTGAGAGTMNFDENSVGTDAYQRLLLEGTHFECGDVIMVEFTSDGELTDLGEATVSVIRQ